ncbi:MAG: methyl-accepting chemotaxis protein [Desulfomonilia bacterium]
MKKECERICVAMPQEHSESKRTRVKRGLSFRRKVLLLVVLFNIISTGVFSLYFYQDQKILAMRDIDNRLLASANAVRYILPDGYHIRITSDASVPLKEHLINVHKLSQYAKYAHVTYLYTMMESGGNMVFTSTSATDEEFKKGTFNRFFTVYKGATTQLKQAFDKRWVSFEESHDQYGDFRSVIVPVIMPSGKVYIMVADLDIRSIHAVLARGFRESLLIGAVLFISTMTISIIFLRRFTSSIEKIVQTSKNFIPESAELVTRNLDQNNAFSETSKTLEDLALIIGRSTEEVAGVESYLKAFNEAVLGRMNLIDSLRDSMEDICALGTQIEKIVVVINEIAFQANMLSLSASVEAQRAGAAGMGFWVVVEEVRNLARKTIKSSQDIREIVYKDVNATRKGVDLAKETSEFFHMIIEQGPEIVAKISHIAEVSRKHSADIEYINEAISRTRDIVAYNADSAVKLAEDAQKLYVSINSLEEILGTLKDV